MTPITPRLRAPAASLALLLAVGSALLAAAGCRPPAGEPSSAPEPSTASAQKATAGPTGGPAEPQLAAEPRRLTIQEVRRMIEEDDDAVVLVDVRSRDSYDRRHARGAVSLPLAELPTRARDDLPVGPLLVTYCT